MNVFLQRYKIPILISLVSGLAFLALTRESNWINAILAFLGALFGMILIDSESVIYVYLLDTSSERAKKIKSLVKSFDVKGFAQYLEEYDYTFGESSIKSVFFQLILFVFSLYVITTGSMVFVQTLTLSMFANLLYSQHIELQKTSTLQRWFWLNDGKFSGKFFSGYLVLVLLLVIFQYTFL